MNLHYLLRPKSVAIVGVSEKPGFGRSSCLNMLGSGLGENLYFINPKRERVFGKKCYKSLKEIGKPIDMVIICTPQPSVNDIIEEAAQCGCKSAVVYASGYSETGKEGELAQEELKNLALRYNMAICGPNCAGYINNVDNVPAFGMVLEAKQRKGNIGLVAQSGQVCSLLVSMEQIKFAYAISSGNGTIIEIEDYMEFLINDESTEIIAVYLEGISNNKKFAQVLTKAAAAKKPIVALKVGISEKGQQTATAHTGSLAGSDSAYDAVFKKFGVIRVHDMEELVNVCSLLSTLKNKRNISSFAMLNLSGGEAAIMADLADIYGIRLTDFKDETLDALKRILPSYATPNNPLDATATLAYDHDIFDSALDILLGDPGVDMLIMGFNIPESVTEQNKTLQYGMAKCLVNASLGSHNKPIAVMPLVSGKRSLELRDYYLSGNVPIFDNPIYGLNSLRKYSEYTNYKPPTKTLSLITDFFKNSKTGEKILTEHESKVFLNKYNIPVTEEYIAKSVEEAIDAANKIGFPVVLKIDSPDIPHKTDIGGVILNINDEASLIKGFITIMENARSKKSEAKLNGVLVQKMMPKTIETIVGVKRDPQLGPIILIGLGGIFVEIFKDIAMYPAPLNEGEALEMISSLKGYPLLTGYRGSVPLDIKALARTIVSVGNLAVDNINSIKELDINPLFVYPKDKGVCAADALIIKG